MAKSSFLCVLLLCALQTGAQQSAALPATASEASIDHVQQLFEQGRLDQAMSELNALAAQHPEPAGAERMRGLIFYQQNKFNDADAAFTKALADNPKDTEALQMRGVTLFRMGRPADAIPLLEAAHAAVPNANIDPNYVLGVSYLLTNRFDDARPAFAAQYGFAPDSAPAYLLTARMCFHQEMVAEAGQLAQQAIQINPKLPLAHLLLGEIALARAEFSDAVAEFEKEREINPLNGEVYDRLADAYIHSGQYDKAQSAINRAVLLEPNATGPYILLGRIMLNQQNPAMATMYLERALHMDPNNYITHALLAQAYGAQGRRDDAAREFHLADSLQSGKALLQENPR